MRSPGIRSLTIALTLCAACEPGLGECDPVLAETLYYTEADGLPSFGGQALMDAGCVANGRCHASTAMDANRFGAPAGYDLDVRVALSSEELERLASSLARVRADAALIHAEVKAGRMPPPEPARSEALDSAPVYRTEAGDALPMIGTDAATEVLRNWLACGAPVVEAIEGTSTGLGEIVPALDPGIDCPTGQAECEPGVCRDVTSDPARCGSCDNDCGGLFCAEGVCTESCPTGTLECAGGCVNPQTNPSHCGDCATSCGSLELCEAGACVCGPGTADCGSGCIDTSIDPANCGGCGVACGAGESCSAGACVSCSPAATLSGDVQPIFSRSCAITGCHTSRRPSAGLLLDSGSSHGSLVGVRSSAAMCSDRVRVVAGDPEASYLLDKLMGDPSICGVQMPRRGESIPASEIELIRGWICRGAPND